MYDHAQALVGAVSYIHLSCSSGVYGAKRRNARVKVLQDLCKDCGQPLVREDVFCRQCGARVQAAQQEASNTSGPPVSLGQQASAGASAAAGLVKDWWASQQEKRRQAEEDREYEIAQSQMRRADLLAELQTTCPFQLDVEVPQLPGKLQVLPDEFFVRKARDWGWSSQRLVLTTHRLIHSHGRLSKDQEVVYLTDVRDVKYHRPLVGHASLTIETAGGHGITGLPAAKNGRQVRNEILQLVHWARQRAQAPNGVPPLRDETTPQTSIGSKYDQLHKLGELKAAGILSESEFEQEKQKILRHG